MKVLAKTKTGQLMTFDNIKLFDISNKEFFNKELIIVESDYITQSNETSIDDIQIEIIEPDEKNNLLELTVKDFYEKQHTFNDDDLKVLLNHKSQTISNLAKKRLSKKS